MNAHANTTIFLIYKTFIRLFLFIASNKYVYVCLMKNKPYKQINLLFIFILDKLFRMSLDKVLLYPHNKDGGKIYPPY